MDAPPPPFVPWDGALKASLLSFNERLRKFSEEESAAMLKEMEIGDMKKKMEKLEVEVAEGVKSISADKKELKFLKDGQFNIPKLIDYVKQISSEGIVCDSKEDVVALGLLVKLTGVNRKACVDQHSKSIDEVYNAAKELRLGIHAYCGHLGSQERSWIFDDC